MKGALRTLHIRCGDDIRDRLVEAGVEGDYLSFADPAWLGPPPASNAWIAGRAALIGERTGLSRQKIRADLGDAYWRLARAPADYGRIVLWGEHDLYDQAALVRVLASFAPRKKLPRIELISIDRFRGIKRFIGLGQLSATQLATLWPRRKRISRRQLALGAKAWAALRAPTPEPLEALCKGDLRVLPFLKAALQRQLQELPWTSDGLSLTERNALVVLAKGAAVGGGSICRGADQARSAALHGRSLLLVGAARSPRSAASANRGQCRDAPGGLAQAGAAPHADGQGAACRQA